MWSGLGTKDGKAPGGDTFYEVSLPGFSCVRRARVLVGEILNPPGSGEEYSQWQGGCDGEKPA